MNFLQSIIRFIARLLGQKTSTPSVISEPKPAASPPKKDPVPEVPKAKKQPDFPISEDQMNQMLYLGHYQEKDISPDQIEPILRQYHSRISDSLREKNRKLRNGDTFSWVDLEAIQGDGVKTIQSFLVEVGIFPEFAAIDGYFGYATQAGVRLFQEYERTHSKNAEMIPNGIVDQKTWKVMKYWQDLGKKADKWSRGVPSAEFDQWMRMLQTAKAHYQRQPHLIIDSINKKVDELNKPGQRKKVDTFKIEDWTFDAQDIHLIGIRRNEDDPGKTRVNDDLFVLLINGMVFKFWGSTDPRQFSTTRKDEAFLVEGQHKFRFGWHKIGNEHKLYQGLNPYDRGVLVFRDDIRTNDDRLTEADIKKGIDDQPNTTINIHWTGIGGGSRKTWSAGCQVLAAKSYIDNHGKEWDCSDFLASDYEEGGRQKETQIHKTKGAYNVFIDLIVCYRPNKVDYIYYTLGRDETLKIDDIVMRKGDKIVSDSIHIFGMPKE